MDMKRNRRSLALGITTIVATAASWIGVADTTGAGTAKTELSLVKVSVAVDPNLTQMVEVGKMTGFATNDPVRNALTENLASVFVQMLGAEGAVDVDCTTLDVIGEPDLNCLETSVSGDGSEADVELVVDLDQDLGQPQLAAGEVSVGARQATTDATSSLATLAQVEANADVGEGLVVLEGVTVGGHSDEATLSFAEADVSVTVDKVYVFAINQLLAHLGETLADVTPSNLVILAESLAPGSADALESAIQAYNDIEAESEEDAAALATDLAELTDGDLDLTADAEALQRVLAMATKYSVGCASATPTQCAGLITLAMQGTKDVAAAALELARSELAATIGDLPLITFTGLTIGENVEVTADGAQAVATIDWGTASVAGVELPVEWTLETLRAAVESAVAAIETATGQDLGVELGMPDPTTFEGTDGVYLTGSATLTAFSINVWPAALGSTMGVSADILSLSAFAEFRPAVVDPDPTCETDPTLCPPDPTCDTDPTLCPPDQTCDTDPTLCPPDPTCETDPSLCPPDPTCETDPSLCPDGTGGTSGTGGTGGTSCDPATQDCDEGNTCDTSKHDCDGPTACNPATQDCDGFAQCVASSSNCPIVRIDHPQGSPPNLARTGVDTRLPQTALLMLVAVTLMAWLRPRSSDQQRFVPVSQRLK